MELTKDLIQEHQVALSVAVTSVVGLLLIQRYIKSGQCRSKVKLTGKTALVTGANTGIGKETARDFAERGARVLLACRDISKAEKAATEIRESSGNSNVVVYKLDLSSLDSVRACAAEVNEKESRLDILVNNAGVMWTPHWKTADGFELQFGTNHLGHFLLTNLLLDLIKDSAPSRIVNVSSLGHSFVKGLDFENLNGEKSYNPVLAYSTSKLANILFTRELSKRLKGTGVTTNSLCPGPVSTELVRYMNDYAFYVRWPFMALFHCLKYMHIMKTPKDGAQTSIYLSVSEEVEDVTGKYFSGCALTKPRPFAEDDEVAAKLWEVSVQMTGLK